MYCPKCTIDIDHNESTTCPYCATTLVEIPAQTHDVSTGETITFQLRASSSNGHQSQSRELLDKAFEELHKEDQRARAPGSKSLAITAILGALLLLSVIGTGIYYLNHTTAHEKALQPTARILTLPSSEAPAPTLKSDPLWEQQNQNGTTHTAQDGWQAKQGISEDQTPVTDSKQHAADSPEPHDVQGRPTKQAQTAGTDIAQKNAPSSGDSPSSTATSQAPPAEIQARPRAADQDSSGTIATTQISSVPSAANGLTNSESGSHILLCGSFQSKEKALKQVRKIQSKGYQPFVEKADLGNKGVWYRIKIAGFTSKDAAEKARNELKSKLKLEAIVAKRK